LNSRCLKWVYFHWNLKKEWLTFTRKKNKLEKLDPTTMETFAIETIDKEKEKSDAIHDLEILEYNMKLLNKYSVALKQYTPDTNE